MSTGLAGMSARELSALVQRRAVSPVEIVEDVLSRIDECQSRINAFISVAHDEALEAAREAEREIMAERRRGPLHGLPYAAKDLIMSVGMRTTMGSRLFEASIPERDAVTISRLRAEGAILVGKTTTSEFGHKPFTDGPLFGRTLNPFDANATCGGSSGGSAAALASGQVPLALGSDGGGSIRIPAACCGIVGLKATLGVIPHLDVPDLFSANAYVGPMARSVDDVDFLFGALRGFDRRDPYGQGEWARRSPPFFGIEGLRIGWMERVGNPITDPECIGAAERALRQLESAGAVVEPATADFAPWRARSWSSSSPRCEADCSNSGSRSRSASIPASSRPSTGAHTGPRWTFTTRPVNARHASGPCSRSSSTTTSSSRRPWPRRRSRSTRTRTGTSRSAAWRPGPSARRGIPTPCPST